MHWLHHYVVDWDKVKTVDDIKRILVAMQIAFEPDSEAVVSLRDILLRQEKPPMRATMD